MNIEVGLTQPPPVRFRSLFKDLLPAPPRRTCFSNYPFIKKSKKDIDIKRKYKEEMEGDHDNAGVFMHLNIKRNS